MFIKSESKKDFFLFFSFFFLPSCRVLPVLGNKYGADSLVIYPCLDLDNFFLCLSTAVGLAKKLSCLE